jgi:CO/xanthine dehydrogenase Mo-binding subunit
MKGKIKIGCKDDGTIVAIKGDYYANVGSSPMNLGSDSLSAITQTYKCPNLEVTKTTVVTNIPWSGYWRSVGEPSGCFMFEMAIDKMADMLDMDPYTFRMKNVFTRDLPHPDFAVPYSSMAMKECFEAVANDINFSEKWHEPNQDNAMPDGRLHGIGISGHVCDKGSHSSPVGAIVNVAKDGTALISAGISRAASGTNSAMCYIVAETLGLPYAAVNVGDWGNTDVCSEGGGQGGSTRTTTLGAAFQIAAEDARDQLFTTAADMIGVPKADLDARDGKIFDKNDESNFKTHSEVASRTAPVIGRGVGWTRQLRLSEEAGFPIGSECVVKTMIASAAEVAVDTETGLVEVLNYVAADDMGRAINRIGTERQILGGNEICHGEAFMWEQLFDEATGICLNPNYLNHKHPISLDINTDKHRAIVIESIDSCGPYGAKGLGEPPVGVYGTINHAVYNAIGKWITTSPIYPQKILEALGKV